MWRHVVSAGVSACGHSRQHLRNRAAGEVPIGGHRCDPATMNALENCGETSDWTSPDPMKSIAERSQTGVFNTR